MSFIIKSLDNGDRKNVNVHSNPILSHYDSAANDLRNAILLVNNRKIKSINTIGDTCQESYPCEGHDGVSIITNDNDEIVINTSSVSIGAIMWYYNIKTKESDHFMEYIVVEDFLPFLRDKQIM
jgi:hypothetical protein